MKHALRYIITAVLIILMVQSWATHNRAGEITYKHISGFTYEVTIRTCTDISNPQNADREHMPIQWGHVLSGGQIQDSIARTSDVVLIPNSIKENYYTTIHTFPGPSTYVLYSEDPNRNDGVNNIPGSVNQVFSITSTLIIYADPSRSFNNSVELLTAPKEDGCVNRLWSHGVAAFDPDGDSLAFELIPCTGGNGIDVPGYLFPDEFNGNNGVMTFDQEYGIVTWDAPMFNGLYNIAIRISEYRNGSLMGTVVRDMQIEIITCPNNPPVNVDLPDVCVVANEDLVVQYEAYDPDGDILELFMEGEPLELGANFTQLGTTGDTTSGTLQWTPDCDKVRLNPYLVYLRAVDDTENPSITDNDGFSITVIGPPVEALATAPQPGGDMAVTWDSYACSDEVVAYKVFRRIGSNPFEPDACETGLDESYGYNQIGLIEDPSAQSFLDMDVPFGNEVCYRVVACYEDGSESIVSDEACDFIEAEIPVMTHVSVGITDEFTGVDTVRWIPPLDIDTSIFVGPYAYKVYRSEEGTGDFQEIFETGATMFLDVGTLEFIDTGLNTGESQYQYKVSLLDNDIELAESNDATSVYLEAIPGDEQVLLTWQAQVPWINTEFEVYRNVPGVGLELLAIVDSTSYLVQDLVNNEEVCFVIRSIGGYTLSGYEGPFFNWSQRACTMPFDNTPPCPPVLAVNGTCEDGTYEVIWSLPDPECGSDVAGYFVYYAATFNDSLRVIQEITSPTDTLLLDFEGDLYGCFAVSAYDSLSFRPDGSMASNEGGYSNIVCVESCPEYVLPDVISPNGDGANDRFIPFPDHAYVDSIDLQVFNRWGGLVFRTEDPEIQWEGVNQDSGERLSDGVYYYTVVIYEASLNGVVPRKEAGYLHIFDNRNVPSE